MTNEFIQKVLRLFLGVMTFLCCLNILGLLTREAHQYVWVLASYILFALLLRNIWLTLFVWLTVFLYSFFKFHGGEVYLTNIFAGCVFFYLTKVAFQKKHIDWFINIVLWVLVANLLYGVVQVLGFDFIYSNVNGEMIVGTAIPAPTGFMSNTGIMGSFIALCIPLIATRRGIFSTVAAIVLFPVLYLLHSSTSLVAGSIAILFVIYFKYSKKLFIISVLLLALLAGGFFITKINTMKHWAGTERMSQWKLSLCDSTIHPITGWGLDSFRSFNERKKYVYGFEVGENKKENFKEAAVWDNPHNLLISLQYEWGFLAIIFLGGYIRQCILWFRASDRGRNVVALAGFIACFFIVSMGHFPIFLARLAIIIVPAMALFEIVVKN